MTKFFEFTATKSTTFIVVAKSPEEARRIAYSDGWDALDGAALDIDGGYEIEADDGFVTIYGEEVPYGETDGQTIAELVAGDSGEPDPDESVGPVHWCAGCLQEPVQFDWREDVQLCPACRTEVATTREGA